MEIFYNYKQLNNNFIKIRFIDLLFLVVNIDWVRYYYII